MTTSIQQVISIAASPSRVYKALTQSQAFSQLTAAPADIATEAGGSFSCFGGMITGRHIELEPNTRIVQAWRAGNWPAGHYSVVRFDLSPDGKGTQLTLTHNAFPAGSANDLEGGWHKMYWEYAIAIGKVPHPSGPTNNCACGILPKSALRVK